MSMQSDVCAQIRYANKPTSMSFNKADIVVVDFELLSTQLRGETAIQILTYIST